MSDELMAVRLQQQRDFQFRVDEYFCTVAQSIGQGIPLGAVWNHAAGQQLK
ncbi:MAG: hypothetical protein ACO24Y_09345 [Hylemonella sp.]